MASASASGAMPGQLSRQQGFWIGIKSCAALVAVTLCALVGGLPGAFLLCEWHERVTRVLLGSLLCLTGAAGGFFLCLKKCSRVVQGILLCRLILSLLTYFFLGIMFVLAAVVAVVFFCDISLKSCLRDLLQQVLSTLGS